MSESDGDSTSDNTSHHNHRLGWPIPISVKNPLTVAVGTLLVLSALGAALSLASNPYSHFSHNLEEDQEAFEDSSDLHYRYEELSPQAQEIFRQTLRADESVDTSEKAPDFEYHQEGEIYIIKYQNELYALSVSVERDGFFLTGAFLMGAIGVVLLVHGSGWFD